MTSPEQSAHIETEEQFVLSEEQQSELIAADQRFNERAGESGLRPTYAYEHANGLLETLRTPGHVHVDNDENESRAVVYTPQGKHSLRSLLPREYRGTSLVSAIEQDVISGDMKSAESKAEALRGFVEAKAEDMIRKNVRTTGRVVTTAETDYKPEPAKEDKSKLQRELDEVIKELEDDPDLRRLAFLDKDFNDVKGERGKIYAQQQRGEIDDSETAILTSQKKKVMDQIFGEMRKFPEKTQKRYQELRASKWELRRKLNS